VEEGVTVQEAMASIQDGDLDYWRHYRAALFDQIAAVERHRLSMSVTTADRLLWVKKRGPGDTTIAKQVAHIKACERG
jgi:hypothetical protein